MNQSIRELPGRISQCSAPPYLFVYNQLPFNHVLTVPASYYVGMNFFGLSCLSHIFLSYSFAFCSSDAHWIHQSEPPFHLPRGYSCDEHVMLFSQCWTLLQLVGPVSRNSLMSSRNSLLGLTTPSFPKASLTLLVPLWDALHRPIAMAAAASLHGLLRSIFLIPEGSHPPQLRPYWYKVSQSHDIPVFKFGIT